MMRRLQRGNSPRRGYVLILVLGIATVVSSAGIAFIHANSTAMPAANNRQYAARALYLAESGVELAKHYLLYSPMTVSTCDYWRGGNNIALDGASNDFMNVAVTEDPQNPRARYMVEAVGVAYDGQSKVMAKKAVRAAVILPERHDYCYSQALISRGSLNVPAAVRIEGDVHANGSLIGSGFCNGVVSASVTASWSGTGPPKNVVYPAPAPRLMSSPASNYASYVLNNQTYAAYEYTRDFIDGTQSKKLNDALDASMATNPGRVAVYRGGHLTFKTGPKFNGTMVIMNGRAEFQDHVEINAVPGFPAIVAADDVIFTSTGRTVTLAGGIITSGMISDNGRDNSVLRVTGTSIVSGGVTATGKDSSLNFIWSSDCSWLFNVSSPQARYPVTVINWVED